MNAKLLLLMNAMLEVFNVEGVCLRGSKGNNNGVVRCCGVLWCVVGCCVVLWGVVECCGVLWGVV